MTIATLIKVSVFANQKGNIDLEIPSSLRTMEDGESKQIGFGVFRIINQKDGDKRIVWNANILDEIQDAKELFNKLIAEGFIPYCVNSLGKRITSIMKEFNPRAEEIIFAPIQAMIGG